MHSLIDKITGKSHTKDSKSSHSDLNSSNAYANTAQTSSSSGLLANNQSGYNANTNLNASHTPTDVNVASGNTQNKAALLEQTHSTDRSLGVGATGATGMNNSAMMDTTMETDTMNTNSLATDASLGLGTMKTAESAAITRSEERLDVGKEKLETGSVGLHKYVTTEHVETAVPITREHVVIEREPITSTDNLSNNLKIGEAHIEMNTTAERAVAVKEVVPIEKIRINKLQEHTEELVAADLRKEHVDVVNNSSEKVLCDLNPTLNNRNMMETNNKIL